MNPTADAFQNMHIVFHIGLHCTDENQISACLGKNRKILAENGIYAPKPALFRPILRETLALTKGKQASSDAQNETIDSILAGADRPERMIFSNETFICGPQKILDQNKLYPYAGPRCRKLYNLFHDYDVEFCLAVRNPATFLPACFARAKTESFEEYISQIDPLAIRWSHIIQSIRQELPGVPLKVWSNEDTPFIWPDLMRKLTNHGPKVNLEGLDGYMSTIMKPEGLERMQSYLQTHSISSETQRRRVISAFLDKFEVDDPTLDVHAPIWTRDCLDSMTAAYEEDLFAIEAMPDVTFISP